MKVLNFLTTAIIFLALSVFTASCSSDDVDNGGNDDVTALPQITGNISADDEEGNARGSMFLNNSNQLKTLWYANDYLWAYSPSKKFYNKLVPAAGQEDDFGSKTSLKFVSTGKVDYTPGEELVILYSGYKDADNLNSGFAHDGSVITFKRSNAKSLAIICGNAGTNDRLFSDEGNSYFFKATKMTINDNGTLSKSTENIRSYMPIIRIGIPANFEGSDRTTAAADATELAKLQYKITVATNIKEETTAGYPNSITYNIKEHFETSGSSVLEYPENYYTWGEPYTVTLKPNNTDPAFASSSLWDSRDGKTNYVFNGYVLIPLPTLNYTKLTVTVEVSDPDGTNTSLANLLGTYTFTTTKFTIGGKDGGTLDADSEGFKKGIVNTMISLGNIWTRGNMTAGGAWKFTQQQ